MAAVLHATVDAARVTQAQEHAPAGLLVPYRPLAMRCGAPKRHRSDAFYLFLLAYYDGGTTTCVHPSSSGASPR